MEVYKGYKLLTSNVLFYRITFTCFNISFYANINNQLLTNLPLIFCSLIIGITSILLLLNASFTTHLLLFNFISTKSDLGELSFLFTNSQ